MANPTNPNANWPDPDTERAQPGDVLGIERGGETTSLGDTEEDAGSPSAGGARRRGRRQRRVASSARDRGEAVQRVNNSRVTA